MRLLSLFFIFIFSEANFFLHLYLHLIYTSVLNFINEVYFLHLNFYFSYIYGN